MRRREVIRVCCNTRGSEPSQLLSDRGRLGAFAVGGGRSERINGQLLPVERIVLHEEPRTDEVNLESAGCLPAERPIVRSTRDHNSAAPVFRYCARIGAQLRQPGLRGDLAPGGREEE